jgi:hypothetical protein
MSVNTSAFPFINATVNVEAGTTFDAGGVLAIRARDVAFQFAGGPIAAPGAHVQLNLNDTSLIRLGDFSLATGVVALIVKMMRQSGLGNVDVVTLPMFAMASNSQLAFDSFNGSFFDVKTFGGDVTVSTFGVADSTTTANIADPGVCSGAMSLLTFSIYGSQVQLPVFTDSTRPDPAALPAGALIYNSDDNDYNVTDGAGNWRRNGSVT